MYRSQEGGALGELIEVSVTEAGKNNVISIWVQNNIQYDITAYFKVEGDEDVSLITDELRIPQRGGRYIKLVITPSTLRMKPVRFKLKVEYEYVIT